MLRFGIFEIDPAAGELRRNGSIVRLQPQPFQVLLLLAENTGEVVERDRIRQEIWGGTMVDFDRSLNVCIAQIRSALNDDAESPRFIQTLPRKGYRFIAPVDKNHTTATPADVPTPPAKRPRWILTSAAALVLLSAAAAVAYRMTYRPDPAVRLAVLPFDTVSVPSEPDAQVEGIFDELLTRLSGVAPDRLTVVGRRSVLRFRGTNQPLREIGAALHSPYALEGTVRKEPGGIKVAVRLARTESDGLLWSETFEQNGDPAVFEEQLVARVSAGVLAKLFPEAPPAVAEAVCRDGWQAYRTGRLLAETGRLAAMEKSLSFFEQANCPAARGALAETLIRIARAVPSKADWDHARAAAANLDTEPAHLSRGNIAFWHEWNWRSAEREYQAALRINPSNPDAHHDYAWLLVALGRRNEAVAALDRALALDPLSGRTHMDAAWVLLDAGRFDRAAAEARQTLALEPEIREAYFCLTRALLYAGDERGALAAMQPVLSSGQRNAIAGKPPREALNQIFIASPGMEPYQRAWLLARSGAVDPAIAALQEGFAQRNMMMPLTAVDPGFASLRSDPRFRKIVHDLGL